MSTICPERSDYPGKVGSSSYNKCENVDNKWSRMSCYNDTTGGRKVCNNRWILPVGCKSCKKWTKGRCSTPFKALKTFYSKN
jgi:hypothetical protein